VNKRILLIDDEPELVDVIEKRLAANDYEVLTAHDGVEGMVKARDEKPDLIILDIMMPNLDGNSFINEIKEIEEIKDIPIIVLSAKPNIQDVLSKDNVEHFFQKPIDSIALLEKIRFLLDDSSPIDYR